MSGHISLYGLMMVVGVVSAHTLTVPFRPVEHRNNNGRGGRGRREAFDLTAENNPCIDGYVIDMQVGTPAQNTSVRIDVQTRDTWVTSDKIRERFAPLLNCREPGACANPIWPDNSTTAKHIGELSKLELRGAWYSDYVTIGGHSMPNQEFGWATFSQFNPRGALGLGPQSSVLRNMVENGIIDHPSFSLSWSPGYTSGRVIFGGIDTAQFVGNLSNVQMLPSEDGFAVAVSGVGVDGSVTSAMPEAQAVLEPNTENFVLPSEVVSMIHAKYGVVGFPCASYNYTNYIADCAIRDRAAGESVDIILKGATIKVPLRQIVIPFINEVVDRRAQAMVDKDPEHPMAKWKGRCAWTLQPGNNDDNEAERWILGAPFMRSAYVVFDTLNKQVRVAQAGNVSTDKTNIVPISKDVEQSAQGRPLQEVTGLAGLS